MRPFQVTRSRWVGRILVLWFMALVCDSALFAQQGSDSQVVDKETLNLLLNRIDQLEARVKQLEADRQQTGTSFATPPPIPVIQPLRTRPIVEIASPATQSSLTSTPPPPAPADSEQTQSENVMTERTDLSKTLLRIRGFGDFSLHGDTRKGDTTSFSLGQLDLFVTSDISDKFKILGEILFEGGPDKYYGVTLPEENAFTVDIERFLLQYSHNDYFNISAGRGHTAIGYYNTAYYHSTWLQTTTGPPFLFEFEDRGGILPIHNVGASVHGLVPSGRLGLNYVAEVGNGRESRNRFVEEPVQNEVADQSHKALNFALFARPEALAGLQTGFSIYRDIVRPNNAPKIAETILAAHVVVIRPKYEWLNEALLIRHAPMGPSTVFNTPGFYTQFSRQFGPYRPYFRYQYVNVANREPVFADVMLQHGPSLGLRYDASESVALKFQYDYTFFRDQPGVSGLNMQVGFTF